MIDVIQKGDPMKRMAGSLLVVLSIACMTATLLWAGWETVHPSHYPGEDRVTAIWLFAGILLMVEGAVFMTGCYLRHPRPPGGTGHGMRRYGRHLLPLAVYVAGSIGIALLGALIFVRELTGISPLWLLVCQPSVLVQLVLGGLLGIKIDTGTMSRVYIIGSYLVYFLVLFYPLYRVITIDRTVEPIRHKHMKMLLALFAGVHLLTALLLGVLMRA